MESQFSNSMRNIFLLLLSICTLGHAQDPLRFKDEVMDIQKKYDSIWDASKETIVFTGSSSVRLWKNLEDVFPGHQIVNSGFGGSQAIDLLAYSEELILRFNPKKVFIYEGDNDIYAKKKPKEIIATTQEIIHRIKQKNSRAQIVLIGAKPSIARWDFKRKYRRLNRKIKKLCQRDSSLQYANVWDAMVDGRKLRTDIFIEDGLHMNTKGYELWYSVVNDFIN